VCRTRLSRCPRAVGSAAVASTAAIGLPARRQPWSACATHACSRDCARASPLGRAFAALSGRPGPCTPSGAARRGGPARTTVHRCYRVVSAESFVCSMPSSSMAPVVRVRLPPLPTSTPQPGRWCPRGRTGPLLPSTTGPFLDSAEVDPAAFSSWTNGAGLLPRRPPGFPSVPAPGEGLQSPLRTGATVNPRSYRNRLRENRELSLASARLLLPAP
jgi:hypothetical protein